MQVLRPRLSRLALICLIGALALPGCGFGGGQSDREQITDVVNKAFTDDDPKLCGQVLSQSFIKTFYGTVGKCEQNAAKGANADSVDVLRLTVTGDTAKALIMASGGSASPKPVTLKLVKEDGDWKIDALVS
jgi:hypothetical protein